MAEKIGFVAIITRTLATAVCCNADMKAKLETPHQIPETKKFEGTNIITLYL